MLVTRSIALPATRSVNSSNSSINLFHSSSYHIFILQVQLGQTYYSATACFFLHIKKTNSYSGHISYSFSSSFHQDYKTKKKLPLKSAICPNIPASRQIPGRNIWPHRSLQAPPHHPLTYQSQLVSSLIFKLHWIFRHTDTRPVVTLPYN